MEVAGFGGPRGGPRGVKQPTLATKVASCRADFEVVHSHLGWHEMGTARQ